MSSEICVGSAADPFAPVRYCVDRVRIRIREESEDKEKHEHEHVFSADRSTSPRAERRTKKRRVNKEGQDLLCPPLCTALSQTGRPSCPGGGLATQRTARPETFPTCSCDRLGMRLVPKGRDQLGKVQHLQQLGSLGCREPGRRCVAAPSHTEVASGRCSDNTGRASHNLSVHHSSRHLHRACRPTDRSEPQTRNQGTPVREKLPS